MISTRHITQCSAVFCLLALCCSSLKTELSPDLTPDIPIDEAHENCNPRSSSMDIEHRKKWKSDCSAYPFEVCEPVQTICVHKGVFPVLWQEVVGLIVLPFLMGISSVAGVGGGIVFVPIAMALFSFKSKEAVAISIAIVFQSGFIRTVFFSMWAKHPERETTEIDYNTVRIVYPLFLIGSYFGVLTSIALSELFLCASLCLLLIYLVSNSFQKGRKMWKVETTALRQQADEYARAADENEDQSSYEPRAVNESKVENENSERGDFNALDSQTDQASKLSSRSDQESVCAEIRELECILEREKSTFGQWRINLQVILLTLLSVVVNLLRGSPDFKSIVGFSRCGGKDWSVLVAFIVLCLLVCWKNFQELLHEQRLKRKYNKGLCQSDILLEGENSNRANVLVMGFVGSWIGVTFGLGGGSIYNPFQISLGINPIVAASTSMYMIMFASLTSTMMYLVWNKIDIVWTAWFYIWCGIGVFFGMIYIQGAIKRTGRASLVVLLLAASLAISTVIGTISNIEHLIESQAAGRDIMKGDPLCPI